MRNFFAPRWLALCIVLLLVPCGNVSRAQEIRLDSDTPAGIKGPQHVSFDSESVSVGADKPDWIELRFHVAPGYHINSHTPHDELLIPTTLKLGASPQLRVLTDSYPNGTTLHLTIGAGETLSVYEGEFRVRVQVLAAKGNSTLAGVLHYQACDAASCFPPRDLPLSVPVSAH